MKLLLTGLPGTGKTTVIQHLITRIPQAFWVTSAEMRDEHGSRIGFEAKTSTGLDGIFAHKQAINSKVEVGEYKVDMGALDKLFTHPITQATASPQLLIIDEIGRMQMLSPSFGHAVKKLLASDCDVVATIRYGDDWTNEFTGREDAVVVTLSLDNRTQAKIAIEAMIEARSHLSSLSIEQQKAVTKLARQYAQSDDLTRLKKLYKNAVKYVVEKRIESENDYRFTVKGDHDIHVVGKVGGKWACDCDLFNGKGQFAGHAGECSHIQAVKLLLIRQ